MGAACIADLLPFLLSSKEELSSQSLLKEILSLNCDFFSADHFPGGNTALCNLIAVYVVHWTSSKSQLHSWI